jgi:hypothetical protein
MSETLKDIQRLAAKGELLISEHGYDELAADDLTVDEVIAGVEQCTVIEDYPEYHKGPAVLVLQADRTGEPVHAVWGISKGSAGPAVLVTAYRPDPDRWTEDFRRRRR